MDLLKMLDNRKFPRGERFKVLGLVNEPGFRAASKPDEFGLWLDEEVEPEPAGIDRTVYGKPSGVLGFRLFPNPDFNEEARKKWKGDRFMNDPTYYNDNKLIRPYRVGASERLSQPESNEIADAMNRLQTKVVRTRRCITWPFPERHREKSLCQARSLGANENSHRREACQAACH